MWKWLTLLAAAAAAICALFVILPRKFGIDPLTEDFFV